MKFLKISMAILLAVSLFVFWRHQSRNYQFDLLMPDKKEAVSSLNIGTYNIKTLNQGQSLNEVVSDLKEANLDIVCMQEVDEKSWRSKNMAMTKDIAEALGYSYYYFYQTMFLGKGYYGLAIVSRYPILEVGSESLKTKAFREPRILAYAKIDVGSEPLNVYITHLSFRPLEDKYQQMQYLQERLKNSWRTVLIGDFNIFKDDDFFGIEGMQACNQINDKYITFRDFGFPDNIFYSKDLFVNDLKVQETSFSDHHLFYGTLHLDEGEKNG